jgi:hypothetical protein
VVVVVVVPVMLVIKSNRLLGREIRDRVTDIEKGGRFGVEKAW